MRGVSLDALNPAGAPNMDALKTLAYATGHRLVAFDDVQFYNYVQQLYHADFDLGLVLTLDSFDSASSYYDNAVRWARRMRPLSASGRVIWIIGNEWNISGDASWPSKDQYVGIYNQIASGLRTGDSDAQLYIGGMFSEPNLLATLLGTLAAVDLQPNGVDVHLYLDDIDATTKILQDIEDQTSLEVCMGEWNWQGGTEQDFIDYQTLLNKYTDHSYYFCWNDGMVADYGLIKANGVYKQEFAYYSEALSIG